MQSVPMRCIDVRLYLLFDDTDVSSDDELLLDMYE